MRKLQSNISGLFIIVFLLIASCQPSQSDLEIEVINDILPELISEYSDLALLRYKRGARTLLIDTPRVSAIGDLIEPEPEKMSVDRFESFFGIESDWQELVSKINNPTLPGRGIDISQIELKGYEIESVTMEEEFKKEELVGIISFSNLVFDKDQSRACFFYIYACGGECNVGYYIFVEKTPFGWKIVHANSLWVA